jgi:hypothetical protein
MRLALMILWLLAASPAIAQKSSPHDPRDRVPLALPGGSNSGCMLGGLR